MGRRTWRREAFLVTALVTAVFFWNLERKSLVVYVPETESGPLEDFGSQIGEGGSEGPQADESGAAGETGPTATEQPDISEINRIRVLVRSDDFVSEYQEEVQVASLLDGTIRDGDRTEKLSEGETLNFSKKDARPIGDVVVLSGSDGDGSFALMGLKRGYENPVYEGTLTLIKTDQGYLVINELPLERYLAKVVPSEMPAAYPLEALKAQAVCARTYAVRQIETPRMAEGIPADVDDSVNYQVYNNQPEDERCTKALEETKGLLLTRNGELLDALYYSTSCGIDLSLDLSKEAVFCSFLAITNEKDYEKDEPWYRWNTFFSAEQLTSLAAKAGYGAIGNVTELLAGSREESGCLNSLTLVGDAGSETVEGEYQIRKLLNPSGNPVNLQDGSVAPELGMLPSAFFYMVPSYDGETLLGYQLIGGGYGHGMGMSQNGARHMAEDGLDFQKILTYYYGEMELHDTVDRGD